MSTVGYGDLSPTTNFTYVYTIFNIFVGIIFVFPAISAAFTVLLDPPVTACQEKLVSSLSLTATKISHTHSLILSHCHSREIGLGPKRSSTNSG